MEPLEILRTLAVWTPFLAEGFVWNVVISLVAMAVGTLVGTVLAQGRLSERRFVRRASLGLTEVTRNVPTFVFLFYLAFVIPVEFELGGTLYPFPPWLKAALALSIAVVGFVSDNLSVALAQWRRGDRSAALLFVPNWTAYLLVIIMASSTASVIGVGEIVSRCNTVIAAVGRTELMVWIYLYAIAWFFLFCVPLSLLMDRIKVGMRRRLAAGAPALA
jgi:polar amino acid transport system permease protein